MANAIYPLFKQGYMKGDANLSLNVNTAADGPYALLIDTGVYTYSVTHKFYSDLSGIVNSEQRIVNPTISALAVLDGDDLLFTSVSGATAEAIVVFRKNAGANTTWALSMYYDQPGGGLPVIPNGSNVQLVWNIGGILAL
jgi:hypothetical protein